MAMLNINELLAEAQREAQYRVVRYLQNKYLRTARFENEYSGALELIHTRQEAERAVVVVSVASLPSPACQHAVGEDCMTCAKCGRCDETLDESDICDECRKTVR